MPARHWSGVMYRVHAPGPKARKPTQNRMACPQGQRAQRAGSSSMKSISLCTARSRCGATVSAPAASSRSSASCMRRKASLSCSAIHTIHRDPSGKPPRLNSDTEQSRASRVARNGASHRSGARPKVLTGRASRLSPNPEDTCLSPAARVLEAWLRQEVAAYPLPPIRRREHDSTGLTPRSRSSRAPARA